LSGGVGKVLLVACLVIPLFSCAGMILTADHWTGEENYTYYIDINFLGLEYGGVAYWTDYRSGYGEVALQRVDEHGYAVGERFYHSEVERDLFLPVLSKFNDLVYLTYLRTGKDVLDQRLSRTTECELMVLTLDPNDLSPAGPYSDPESLGSLEIDEVRTGIYLNDGRMYITFRVSEGQTGLREFPGVEHFRLRTDDPSPRFENVSEIEEEVAIFCMDAGGNLEVGLFDLEGYEFTFASSGFDVDGNGTWSGIDLFIVDEDDETSAYLLNPVKGVVNNWTGIPRGLDDFDMFRYYDGGIFLAWDNARAAFLSTGSNYTSVQDFRFDMYDDELTGAAVDKNGNITLSWKGTRDVGDDDTEDVFYFVQTTTELHKHRIIEGPRDIAGCRCVYREDGSVIGIVASNSNYLDLLTFTLRERKLRIVENIGSSPGPNLWILLGIVLLGFIIGIIAVIVVATAQKRKNLKDMSREQLEMYSSKYLRRSVPKQHRNLPKSKLIDLILEPEKYLRLSEDEQGRLFNYIQLKYFYYFLLIVAFVPLLLAVMIEPSPHPAYIAGFGVQVETLILVVILSVLFSALVKEWGTTVLRKITVAGMGICLFLGEMSLLMLIVLLLEPDLEGWKTYFSLFSLGGAFTVLGLAGPFINLYDRKGKKSYLLLASIFVLPLIGTVLSILSLMGGGIDTMPTPTLLARTTIIERDIPKIVIYLFAAMGGGLSLGAAVKLRDVKPMERWTYQDMNRLRRPPFYIAIAGVSLTAAPLIMMSAGENLGSGWVPIVIFGVFANIIIGIGALMWWGAMSKLKDIEGAKGGISNILVSLYFLPGFTLIGALLLGMAFGPVGALVGIGLTCFQLIYGNRKAKENMKDFAAEMENKLKLTDWEETVKKIERSREREKKRKKRKTPGIDRSQERLYDRIKELERGKPTIAPRPPGADEERK